MNQTARYIILTLLIIAIVIWSVTVYRSCQEAKEPVADLQDTTAIDIDTSDLEDLYSEEEDTTADEFVNTAPVETEEDETPQPDYGEPETADFGDGEFLVIAGAYKVEANAKKIVNRLNQQGYKNAEIRVFVGSPYHSVIVGAFVDMDAAFDVAIKLADAGYKDVYVHKKRSKKTKK